MSLHTYAGIRVKQMILSLVSEIIHAHPLLYDVHCEPVYYANMDATALRTHYYEDGKAKEVLVVFRVQRPTTTTWQIHVMAKHSDLQGPPESKSFDFHEADDISVFEAASAASWAMLSYLQFCTYDATASLPLIWGDAKKRQHFASEVLRNCRLKARHPGKSH